MCIRDRILDRGYHCPRAKPSLQGLFVMDARTWPGAALREHVSQLLRAVRPDLLVLPEEVISIGIPAAHGRGAEPISGPTVAAMIEMAGAFKANICIPIIEDDGGAWYNTAVYVGRDGQIAGCYRKQVPTPGEIDDGIRPGGAGQPAMVIDGPVS